MLVGVLARGRLTKVQMNRLTHAPLTSIRQRNCVENQHCIITALQKKVQAPKSGLLPFKLAPATVDQAKGRAQSEEVGNKSTSSHSRGQREEKHGADSMGTAKAKEIMLIAMLSNRGDMEDKQRINILRKEDLNCFRPRLAVTKATAPNSPVTVESIVTFPINVLVNMQPKLKKQ